MNGTGVEKEIYEMNPNGRSELRLNAHQYLDYTETSPIYDYGQRHYPETPHLVTLKIAKLAMMRLCGIPDE